MTSVISSRTPEGEPFRCVHCGLVDRVEPTRPPGDAPCPTCGQLVWFASFTNCGHRTGRSLRQHADALLRHRDRRPLFGIAATLGRQVERVVEFHRRHRARREVLASAKSGVYDTWLDS